MAPVEASPLALLASHFNKTPSNWPDHPGQLLAEFRCKVLVNRGRVRKQSFKMTAQAKQGLEAPPAGMNLWPVPGNVVHVAFELPSKLPCQAHGISVHQ
jgi:hypothetical protein